MEKKVTLIVAGITVILSSVSLADGQSGFMGPPPFEEVDTNGDFQISRDEFDAAMQQWISGQDGPVRILGGRVLHGGAPFQGSTGNDTGKALPFRMAPTFAEIDSNGDLIITEEEFDAFMAERQPMHQKIRCHCADDGAGPFDRADGDGDGVLSQEEYGSVMEHGRVLRKGD